MTTDADARARIRLFLPPITIILVCIPLILKMIPRNGLWGVRTHETMVSDAAWYPANQIGGIALVGACLIWIASAIYAPRRYVTPIGVGTVLLVIALLFISQGWSL